MVTRFPPAEKKICASAWRVRGGRRKAGSGVTEQGTDQRGRSGSRRGNEQVMNKFKLKATS